MSLINRGWLAPLHPQVTSGSGDRPQESTLKVALFGHKRESDAGVRDLAKKHSLTSMIGEGMVIAGPVSVRDSLMVFGRIFGNVTVTGPGGVLFLREGCGVKGEIKAPIVLVKGRVVGTIIGKTVRLYPEAHVSGCIQAEKLIVDDGATIETASVRSNITTPRSTADPLTPADPKSSPG